MEDILGVVFMIVVSLVCIYFRGRRDDQRYERWCDENEIRYKDWNWVGKW